MISTLTKAKLFLKFAIRDIECGMHSGFKPCCIFCYAILDNISNCDKRRFHNWRRYLNRAIQRYRHVRFGYIPCPVCIWGEPVEVFDCERETDHPWDFVSQKEMDQFIKLKDLHPLHENLIKIENIMNWLLKEDVAREY